MYYDVVSLVGGAHKRLDVPSYIVFYAQKKKKLVFFFLQRSIMIYYACWFPGFI